MKTLNKQKGLSIVEVMIALVVAALLLAGVGNAYISSRDTFEVTDNMARMQENARFAVDALAREIRQAGGSLCKLNESNSINTLNSSSEWVGLNDGIRGFDGVNSVFPDDGFPPVGTAPGNRVAGSDAFISTRGTGDGYSISGHNPSSAQFKLNKDHDFAPGDIMVICDGQNSGVFQITNANTSNLTIVHNTGGGSGGGKSISPGNCTKTIKGQGNCDNMAAMEQADDGYTDGSQIIRFASVGYFVGVSQDGESNSLYQAQMTPTDTGLTYSAQEVVPNVETLQLQYGVDQNLDGFVDSYMKANDIENTASIEWSQVLTVKLGLLLDTPEEIADEDDDKFYTVAGEKVGPSATIQHGGDKRLRFVASSVVKLRNRGEI